MWQLPRDLSESCVIWINHQMKSSVTLCVINWNFSRELGDKCVEVSRCLAEIGVIKQELIDKTNLLHASQEMIDNLRTDAEKMRQEFSNYDQMITNTKYETEVMRIHSNYLVSHNSNKLPQPIVDGLGGGLGEVVTHPNSANQLIHFETIKPPLDGDLVVRILLKYIH